MQQGRSRRGVAWTAVLFATLVIAVAGCSSSDDGGSSSSTTPAPVGADDFDPTSNSGVPIPDGRISDAVGQLDGIARRTLDETGVPGMAIAVVHGDEVVYAKGFGVRAVGTDDVVDENTVFQLASVSKPLGATAIAGAVGDGTASWDDRVVDHLPGFELADPYVTENLTIADTYSHRSGLPDHAGDLLEDMGYDRQEVFDRLRFYPLAPFRAEYAYTNFGLTAGGVAVANAAGTTWEDFSEARLYDRLGMDATSSRHADFEAAENHARLHVRQPDGTWVLSEGRQPDAQSPAGGASSSVTDMAKWMQMVLADGAYDGEQVVDSEALSTVLTPHMLSTPPHSLPSRSGFYGLGFNIGTDASGRVRLGHSGAFGLGAATAFSLLPSEDLGIVVLTNGMPIGVPEAVTAEFMDLATLGRVETDWLALATPQFQAMMANKSELAGQEPPATPAPPQALDTYAGTYANELYGDAEVAVAGDGLVLRLGPDGMEFELTHWDGDVFSYTPPGENSAGIAAVTFTPASGSMEVENLNGEDPDDKLGIFTR